MKKSTLGRYFNSKPYSRNGDGVPEDVLWQGSAIVLGSGVKLVHTGVHHLQVNSETVLKNSQILTFASSHKYTVLLLEKYPIALCPGIRGQDPVDCSSRVKTVYNTHCYTGSAENVQVLRYTQSGNGRFLAYIPPRWENQPRAGKGGGCTTFIIMYKVAVYAPAEWTDTLTLFHLYQYLYSVSVDTTFGCCVLSTYSKTAKTHCIAHAS